jgi:hypothetical protein
MINAPYNLDSLDARTFSKFSSGNKSDYKKRHFNEADLALFKEHAGVPPSLAERWDGALIRQGDEELHVQFFDHTDLHEERSQATGQAVYITEFCLRVDKYNPDSETDKKISSSVCVIPPIGVGGSFRAVKLYRFWPAFKKYLERKTNGFSEAYYVEKCPLLFDFQKQRLLTNGIEDIRVLADMSDAELAEINAPGLTELLPQIKAYVDLIKKTSTPSDKQSPKGK